MANLVNGHGDGRTRNIADPFQDLLSELDDGPRSGTTQRLATGYYEGWRPTRTQLANLIAREAGRMTEAEYLYSRRSGNAPESTTPTGPTSAASECRRSPWRAQSWFQPRTSSPAVWPVGDGCSEEQVCIVSYGPACRQGALRSPHPFLHLGHTREHVIRATEHDPRDGGCAGTLGR
jgi:hypothetical protein